MDGLDETSRLNSFLAQHKPQLVTSGVPELFWEILHKKLTNQIFDSGNSFSLLKLEYDTEPKEEDPVFTVCVSKENGIKSNDPNEIYLVDHAWTFRTDIAINQLQQVPGLLDRMTNLMGITKDEDDVEIIIKKVMKKIWKFCNTYSVNADGGSVEDRMPIWYIMDELGSGINHSDNPNFRMIPFYHIPEQITYSILFPISDCEDGDSVTRDFVEGVLIDSKDRQALLLPWNYTSFVDEDFSQKEPGQEYFLSGRIEETLPDKSAPFPIVDGNRPLKVYSDYEFINNYLTDPAFEIVTDDREADVVWYTKHFKGFKEFGEKAPNVFVNQFPFENVLVLKDILSIVCRRQVDEKTNLETLETFPKWLPTTYNLKTELVQFVSYYQNREKKGLDNHWICKPWNLARSLDSHITNDISHLMRLPHTGPKIAQKYIEDPVLFNRTEIDGRVKFDIRYVILLKGTDPVDAYIYKNFFLRFSNKPFSLSDFHDYEKHFTVMNYSNEFELRHLPCAEFHELWSEQYPNFSWDDIEADICKMLKEMFIGATSKKPPCGIAVSPQSRALYAADIMLAWEDGKIQPKLLEVNYTPDCKRACEYYPDFYNDIFKLLFLDDVNDEVFKSVVVE